MDLQYTSPARRWRGSCRHVDQITPTNSSTRCSGACVRAVSCVNTASSSGTSASPMAARSNVLHANQTLTAKHVTEQVGVLQSPLRSVMLEIIPQPRSGGLRGSPSSWASDCAGAVVSPPPRAADAGSRPCAGRDRGPRATPASASANLASSRSSSTVSTLARRMIERSAADVLSSPPKSDRCAAITSLHLRTHGERPSTPGSNALPFVIRLLCRSFGRSTAGRSADNSSTVSMPQLALFRAGIRAVRKPDSGVVPGMRLQRPIPPPRGRRSPASKLPPRFPATIRFS